MSSDNSDQLQKLINARVSERLNFLDPELEATHSRIDVLETICQANTDRIEAISKHQSKTDRGERTHNNGFFHFFPSFYYFLFILSFSQWHLFNPLFRFCSIRGKGILHIGRTKFRQLGYLQLHVCRVPWL